MNTVVIKKYSDNKKQEWNDFVELAKNTLFMFNRDYMDYHKDRFEDHSLMFYEDDRLVGVLPANIKDSVLYSHGGLTFGGLIVDDRIKQHTVNSCFDSLIEYAKEKGINNIHYKTVPHIYHMQPAEEDIYALYAHGAKIFEISASTIIDLSKPLKMPKGRKAQISRAKREGVDIRKVEEKSFYDIFIDMENKVLESRHNTKAVHTSDELFLLKNRFWDGIHLYGAFIRDELIAGTVVYEYRNVIHTQYMATNDIAREIGALDLTINTIMDIYKDSKRWLDFGISTEHGKIYLNEGLISQKEGFGGRTNVYQEWVLEL